MQPVDQILQLPLKTGFSTIEILIAFSIGIIFLSAAIMIAYTDPTLNRQLSLDSSQAIALDAILDNHALATSSNQLGAKIASLSGDWSPTTDSVIQSDDPTNLTLRSNITDISYCLREIISSTTWQTSGDRQRVMIFSTATSNIKNATAVGRGACDPIPSGDWGFQELYDENSAINYADASEATGIAVRSRNGTPYAFITANPLNSGSGQKYEFNVVAVTNNDINENPIYKLSLDKGLLGITIHDRYAYVLQNDPVYQLRIIDIGDPTNPVMLTQQIALTNIGSCTDGDSSCHKRPRSITYYDGYLFIGTGRVNGNGAEFHALCISRPGCSLTDPTVATTTTLNLEHNINDIHIAGHIAYLATSDNSGEVITIDISNMNNLIGNNANYNDYRFDASGNHDGNRIYVLGRHIFLGRVSAANPKFIIIDATDRSSLQSVASVPFTGSGAITGIKIRGKTAFVAMANSSEPFAAIDISQPSSPLKKTLCEPSGTGSGNLNNVASGLDFYENRAFLIQKTGTDLMRVLYEKNQCN